MRGVLTATDSACGARLEWADVEATSFDIVVVRIATGESFTMTVGDVTGANVDLGDYTLEESFRFEVFSVNGRGQRTTFPISATLYVENCFG